MKRNNERTRRLVQLALLAALELVLAYTPLGYLPVGPLKMSFLTIPVAVGAILLGPGAGALLGGVFGFTSFFDAMAGGSAMGTMLFSINPFFTFLTCVGARVLCGYLCGLLYGLAKKAWPKKVKTCCLLGGLAAPVLNTVFFMGLLMLFFYRTDYVQGLAANLGAANPFMFVVLLVGVQGLAEAVACCVVTAAVSLPLLGYLHKPQS